MVSASKTIGRPRPARLRATVRDSWRLSPYIVLFLTLLAVYSYTPPRWQDWNQNSRFNLTQAIVERGTVRIDAYAGNTGDYARVDGHIYTDKAPGLSLMAVPVYALTHALEQVGLDELTHRLGQSGSLDETLRPDGEGLSPDRTSTAFALYLATIVTVAIPAALMIVLLGVMVERMTGSRIAAIGTALILGIATPVFSYSQAFYGHVPAAACLVGALALLVLRDDGPLSNRRLLGVGFLLGWAIVIEYPVALLVAPIALWTLIIARHRAALLGTLGAAPALLTLAIYDLIAFGTILPVGYQHSELWQEEHATGFLSITHPHFDALYGLSFSPFRGLFFFAPALLLCVPGAYTLLKTRRTRAIGLVACGAFAIFFVFTSSSIMWWGGFSAGPRYLVPAVPFLAIPLGATLAGLLQLPRPSRMRILGTGVVLTLFLVSTLLTWIVTFAGQGYPPDTFRRPLTEYALPAIQNGDVARNLGMLLNLSGVPSFLPLMLVVGLGCLAIAASLRPERAVAQP